MKQQVHIPSQNPTFPLKHPQPKLIIPCSFRTGIARQKNMNVFKSKKRIRRYEQILEAVAKQGERQETQSRRMGQGQLKNFIVGELNRINIGMAPLTMKLVQKNKDQRERLRCSTQSNEGGQDLLFTFYPKQKLSQDHTCETSSGEVNPNPKKMEQRSFSLKNSPIVNYPVSSKILPKAFRVRTEGDSGHFKRSGQLLAQSSTQKQEGVLGEKESNRMRTRNFSMKCRMPYDSNGQILQKFGLNRQQRPC